MAGRSAQGAVAALVLVALPALLAVAGLAVDGAVLAHAHLALQAAADAAALAATDAYDRQVWQEQGRVVLREDAARELAVRYLRLNLPAARLDGLELDAAAPGRVVIHAAAAAPTFFLRLAGLTQVPLAVRATAVRH